MRATGESGAEYGPSRRCCPYAARPRPRLRTSRRQVGEGGAICPFLAALVNISASPEWADTAAARGEASGPAYARLGEAADGGEGDQSRAASQEAEAESAGAATDPEASTAAWLGKVTLALLFTVSIAYVCLAAAMPQSGGLQAAERLLPFLTGLVGLVFGFYFSPWRRGR